MDQNEKARLRDGKSGLLFLYFSCSWREEIVGQENQGVGIGD